MPTSPDEPSTPSTYRADRSSGSPRARSSGFASTPTFNCGSGCFQATQPISAAALPLPSGAASAANQTTANTSLASIATEDAAFQGAVAMTVGTTYTAQRSVGASCTVAGNMSVTFTDASTLTVPVAVGWQTFPFAITAVNSSGTTATCAYSNLK